MNEGGIVEVRQERNYAPHKNLMIIARDSEQACRPDPQGNPSPAWQSHTAVAMTFTALALEGLANTLGVALCPTWIDTYERKPLDDKFKAIRRLLGINIDWNKHPWSSLTNLIEFRHAMVHPKHELVVEGPFTAAAEHLPEFLDFPLSSVERAMTPENALLAIRTFDDIFDVLYQATPEHTRLAAFHDNTRSSRKLLRS